MYHVVTSNQVGPTWSAFFVKEGWVARKRILNIYMDGTAQSVSGRPNNFAQIPSAYSIGHALGVQLS